MSLGRFFLPFVGNGCRDWILSCESELPGLDPRAGLRDPIEPGGRRGGWCRRACWKVCLSHALFRERPPSDRALCRVGPDG